MAKRGGQPGNKNGAKENRIFGDELRKAIAQDKRKRVRKGIEKLLDKVAKGDLSAINALADRTDGKPAQAITGADGGDLTVVTRIERVIRGPNAKA